MMGDLSVSAAVENKSAQRTCYKCLQRSPDVRTCAQCKSVMYCSKKCQKDDWPQHKLQCDISAEMDLAWESKLLGHFYKDEGLCHYLGLAVLNKFRSLGRDLSPAKPLIARVFMGFEPTNIEDFIRLRTRSVTTDRGRLPIGMFQLLSISVPKKDHIPPRFRQNMAKFDNSRRILDGGGASHIPLAFLEFVGCNIRQGQTAFSISIATLPLPYEGTPNDVDFVEIPVMSDDGEDLRKPASAEACLELVNMHIRLDKQNQYRLRRRMTAADVEMFSAAMSGAHSTSRLGEDAFNGWREKVAREDIYSTGQTGRLEL